MTRYDLASQEIVNTRSATGDHRAYAWCKPAHIYIYIYLVYIIENAHHQVGRTAQPLRFIMLSATVRNDDETKRRILWHKIEAKRCRQRHPVARN